MRRRAFPPLLQVQFDRSKKFNFSSKKGLFAFASYTKAWGLLILESGNQEGARLLDDFARNDRVLIKRVNGAHSVIAIRDDELAVDWVSDEEERRKLLSGRKFYLVLVHVRVGWAQQR